MLKTVKHFGQEWQWPAYDTELIRVVETLKETLSAVHLARFRGTAVQAGGACGIWPATLAKYFETVHTFEPDPLNFEALLANTDGLNVHAYHAALGAKAGTVSLARNADETTNAGAQYVVPGGDIVVMTIDELNLPGCDFLQLDVEGAEADALKGGEATILRHRPVIMLETKELKQGGSAIEATKLLSAWGYRAAINFKNDTVFTC